MILKNCILGQLVRCKSCPCVSLLKVRIQLSPVLAVQHFRINYIKKACRKVLIPETSINPATMILLPVGRIPGGFYKFQIYDSSGTYVDTIEFTIGK